MVLWMREKFGLEGWNKNLRFNAVNKKKAHTHVNFHLQLRTMFHVFHTSINKNISALQTIY